MNKLDPLIHDFLAQKRIAVVGVSDKRETGCNLAYRKFREAGYTVYAVNPRLTTFEGAPCYPDLHSLPERPDGVFILANPRVTDDIVQQVIDAGVPRVWMHCLMGVKPGAGASMTSVSPAAVELCRQHGIAVIPGTCPNQYLRPDVGHRLMRGVMGLLGNLRLREPEATPVERVAH